MRISDHRRTAVDRRNGFTGRSCFRKTSGKGSSFAAYVRKMTKVNNASIVAKRLESALAETA